MTIDELITKLQEVREELGEDTEVMLEYDGGHYPASRAMPIMFGIYRWREDAAPDYRWCDGTNCKDYVKACNSGHVVGLEIT